MKLSKIEYYNKLIELLDISTKKLEKEEEIKQTEKDNPEFPNMYNQYCEGVEPLQEDGTVDLDKCNYLVSLRGTGNSNFAKGWAVFANLKTYLMKSNILTETEKNKKAIYNGRIAYKLGEQIGLHVAKYVIRKRKWRRNVT